MYLYEVAVIGAGPAGTMAGIRASKHSRNVLLVERNVCLGKKILLTGKGRCNLTNIAPLDEFIHKFGKQGLFLRPAFTTFFNKDLMGFFESQGLPLKVERQGRVFPVTNKAASVVEVLRSCLQKSSVRQLYRMRLLAVVKNKRFFELVLTGKSRIQARKIILATGGSSYRATGSSGDGFRIAKELGHTIIALRPGLVPLKAKESWLRQLRGLTLKNIRLSFRCPQKVIASEVGELLFTHFGVSGPLVLDLSCAVIDMLEEYKEVNLSIDLKPGLAAEQVEGRLLREIKAFGSQNLNNLLKGWLPYNLIPIFISRLGLSYNKKANQISLKERLAIVRLLKDFSLTIVGSLPIEEAMVTSGGVSTREINPKTMESRIIPGLYFAGEIIDICAPSGGYNLQAAFSTGYIAGEHAAGY